MDDTPQYTQAERKAAIAKARAMIEEGVRQADAGDLVDGEEAMRILRERHAERVANADQRQ